LPKTQLSRQEAFSFKGEGRGGEGREELLRRESANGSQSESALTSATSRMDVM